MFLTGKKLLQKIGVDGAIGFTILSRLIQAGGGIILIVIIVKYLTPSEQGYYFTFASILAIQIFFELGLSGIITQYTAHEFAHLKWIDNTELYGEEYYKSRLSSLLRFFVKWFAIIAVILFFVLLISGFYFFNKYNRSSNIEWEKPWIILCLTTSLNLFIDPLLAFFDGLGMVKDMAKVRLIQKCINIVLLFVFFACGFKLYSGGLASLIAICVNYFQIFFSSRFKFLKTIWSSKGEYIINYYKEIFPFQWRIAVSWISGYFIFQLFNPILFATSGPKVAGQMGITIAALTGIASISMSWISTKIPFFSTLIAKGDFLTLDNNFKKIVIQSTTINFVCVSFLIIIVEFAKFLNISFGNRFLELFPFLFMSMASLINQVIFSLATYLRCHKKEPMLLQSVVIGLLTCFSTVVFGREFGVIGVTFGYFVTTCVISLSWSTIIFLHKKKEWHNG